MGEEPRPPLLTAANLLTASRLALLPVIIVGLVSGRGYLAAGGMLLALITDLLDGRLARKLQQASAFGATLDSVVDFVLIYGLFITLYLIGRLAPWQFAVILLAMATVIVSQAPALLRGGAVARTRFSKPAGALQYTFLLFLIGCEVLPALPWLRYLNWALFGVLALAVAGSGIECIASLWRKRRPR
ncbi:MAG TPA: CDP-alcohol phosphatidyltransferase family protein [Armatimonadota bacterium]|nr:CDP-alcohol phosphatidyltransferase family protein [Armatimonadota bacterium]HOS42176.1 CDP-alcohol phosphatidyltransferase family protein [Armatimonadota bacterium]